MIIMSSACVLGISESIISKDFLPAWSDRNNREDTGEMANFKIIETSEPRKGIDYVCVVSFLFPGSSVFVTLY